MPYLVQASLPYFTNLPADVVTNTFHFEFAGGGAPVEADFIALGEGLIPGFYEFIFDPSTGIDMAPWVTPTLLVKIYNLSDPEPRPPVWQGSVPLTVGVASSSAIPPETAAVISYHATPIAGVPQARRRGRLYIGALGTGVASGGPTAFPSWTTSTKQLMADAGEHLLTGAPIVNWTWVVWSRVALSSAPVVGGWFDYSIDTQRRRGDESSGRTLWP